MDTSTTDPALVAAIVGFLGTAGSTLAAGKLYFKAKADNESATKHRKADNENLDSRLTVLEKECERVKADCKERFEAGERRFEKQDSKLDMILNGVNSMREEFVNFKGFVNGLEKGRQESARH